MHRPVRLTIGLAIASLLALSDVIPLPLVDGTAPPAPVLIIGAILAVGTAIGVALVWRRRSRAGAVTVIVTRLLSALSATPVLLLDEAANWGRALVITAIVLALVSIALVAPVLRGNRDAQIAA